MQKRNSILTGGTVVTPSAVIDRGTIIIEREKIVEITGRDVDHFLQDHEFIDCSGMTVLPGFIDVHTHGGAGCDFADQDADTFSRLSGYYFSHGVTNLLATLSPLPHSLLIPAMTRLAEYMEGSRNPTNILGAHLEGPYLNKSMIGGNQVDYVEAPDIRQWLRVREAGKGHIKLMTVAPELDGIESIIEDCVSHGIAISIGHSNADGRTTARAFASGATQVTHLFNSMPSLHHRQSGILSETFLNDRVDAQIIADGVHVNRDALKIALKLKSPDHLLAITDSTRATGIGDGEFTSAGRRVTVQDGIVRSEDGTLAGSTLVLEKALEFLTGSVGMSLQEASKLLSYNPARTLGIEKVTGSLECGKLADIAVLDKSFNVKMTMKEGEIKYKS